MTTTTARPIDVEARSAKPQAALWRRVLEPLASLKLTVTLFTLGIVLIFAGTLAQRDQGIWSVMEEYFRPHGWNPLDWLVWIPLKNLIFFDVPGGIPFPGGFLLGTLLLLNLLAAHSIRFRLQRGAGLAFGVGCSVVAVAGIAAAGWYATGDFYKMLIWTAPGFALLAVGSNALYGKRSGIVMLHAGVILLLAGEFVTGVFATEGNMTIDEGQTINYTEDLRAAELAIIDPSDPDKDHVTVIPHAMIAHAGRVVRDARLPFDVLIEEWMPNSTLVGMGMATVEQKAANRVTAGFGAVAIATPMPPVSGVDGQTIDAPSAYVTLSRNGQTLGTWLFSIYVDEPQQVVVEGKPYNVLLRLTRSYRPYSVTLLDFKHDKFVGTDKPRNFSSHVRLVDPVKNENRDIVIWMNNPMRYDGETFYQSSFKPGDKTSVLQVVRNPGWLLPYISCILVSLGMGTHFINNLLAHMRRTAAS